MKNLVWAVIPVLIAITWPMPAYPQAQPASITLSAAPALRTAIDAAWQRALEATESQGRLARARASRSVAESLWAAPPSLEFAHRDERVIDSSRGRETEVGVAWPLWLPGQRAATGRTADAELSAAEAAQSAARLRIAGEVRVAAWDLAARRAELERADLEAQTLEALAKDVERRIEAGDLARADGLAARSELLSAASTAVEARGRLEAAETNWRVLTGLEPVGNPREPMQPTVELPQHPELALAAFKVDLARRRLDLLRVSRRDPPELAVRLREETEGLGGNQRSVGVAIRVPFGTTDRNAPRQAAANAELDLALAEERRLRDRLAAEVAMARSAVGLAEQQVAAETSRAALLRERAQLIGKSFRAGESPLPEYLRSLGAAAQAEAAGARAGVVLGSTWARLNQSLGLLP